MMPIRYTLPCAAAGNTAAHRASSVSARSLTTGGVFLLAVGDDPVEPRRGGSHEETGDGDAGDRQQDRQENERDRRDREVEQLVHHSTSRIISISTGMPIGKDAMP